MSRRDDGPGLRITNRPSECLEDLVPCTVSGVAEDRLMAGAFDREDLAGIKRTPLAVIPVRGIAAVFGIVNRYGLASRTGGGNGHVKGSGILAARLIGMDADPATASVQGPREAADRQRGRPDCLWLLGIKRPLAIDQIERDHRIEAEFEADR